jgi:hypothetical protein
MGIPLSKIPPPRSDWSHEDYFVSVAPSRETSYFELAVKRYRTGSLDYQMRLRDYLMFLNLH